MSRIADDFPPPEQPGIGAPEDWERIEEAPGYKGVDPERRERLYRHLRTISDSYFGPFTRTPHVRAGNLDRALDALRKHAVALQAYLWWGAPRDTGALEDLLKPPDEPPQPPDDGLSELDRWAMSYIGSEILPPEKQRALLDGLAELIASVEAVKGALPEDRGGRPPNRELRCMIKHLAEYYARETGTEAGISRGANNKKPAGPFFRFVSTVLRVFVPDQVKSDDALYSEIRRTLKIKDWGWGLPPPLGSALGTKTPLRG